MYCRFCSLYCQICLQNSKLHYSQAPGSGTHSWCGVTPDNYLFLTMTIGSIGHPPLSPAAKGLEFLSEGLTFRFVTIHFCNALVKRQQRLIPTTSSFCQDRPAPLGQGERISIVVSCSYYSSFSYFSPCFSYVLLSPGQLQI